LLPLLFDWDEGNVGHVGRHGISPDEVEDALLDPDRIGTAAYAAGDEARSEREKRHYRRRRAQG